MPKPTFFQAVMKKPTRSYADPYHSSPWDDQEQNQQASFSSSRYGGGGGSSYYQSSRYDEYHQNGAGPSRPRRTGSSVSSSVMSDLAPPTSAHSLGSRFPKPARRVVSNITLRDGNIIHDHPTSLPKSSSSAVGVGSTTTTRKKTIKAPRVGEEAISRNGTVKKKKKKPRSEAGYTHVDNESILSSPTSTGSLIMPPPIHSRSSETSSSAPSSPIPPLSPTTSIHPSTNPPRRTGEKHLTPLPLLTPPSSEMSTPSSSANRVPTLNTDKDKPVPNLPKLAVQTAPKVAVAAESDDEDEDEVFYTPRSSVVDLQIPSPIPSPVNSDPVHTPKPTQQAPIPPILKFLPPTPAPIPETSVSPFHSEPSSSASSLHPDRPFAPRPSPSLVIPSYIESGSSREAVESPRNEEEDAQSAYGEAGSDEEESSERQGRSGRSRQTSGTLDRPNQGVWSNNSSVVGHSVPPSVDGHRSASRQSSSRHISRNSSDELQFHGKRRPSIPASEASFVSAPNKLEGSVRGSISGYGKGGWAAANSFSGRSRPSSPVMFMPSSGDGFSDFHVQPPPRQSKFTPLPSASLSPTFDKITDGVRLGGSSARESQNGLVPERRYGEGLRPHSRGDSSPSEYSQLSDGLEGLEMPSRSYLKDYSAGSASRSTPPSEVESGGGEANRTTANPSGPPIPGSLAFPVARVGSLSLGHTTSRPPSRAVSHTQAPSRPMSPAMDYRPPSRAASQATSRPMSPVMDYRPTSPVPNRPNSVMSNSNSPMTFNSPSFLNPDILTILPEMTHEDSDRLYRSAASESGGKGRRTSMQDWGSYNPSRRSSIFRAKSEVGHEYEEDDRDTPLPPPRRSKSVMGFRSHEQERSEKKWEGSSYGDGVLMESNGRASESVGGYTNLILPSGAYRPINPAKSASAVDSRILGMPHATMASIVLSTTFSRHSSTPAHLRDQLPPLVDFSSHLKPPTKVNDHQLLVQVYAVAIDQNDVRGLDEKARYEVGKFVPGRSFVGRALVVGADEKEVVRGDIVIGINDIRKSGALSEYMIIDRRRISRAPFPTQLTLEQLSLLPLQGISAARAVRTHLIRNSRALIINAHTGVAALVCQEMSRSGVNVTAVITGGEDSHGHHKQCLENGARGVLTGSPAAVMLNLEESAWDYVFDSMGGNRVAEAAKRLLKDGGTFITTIRPDSSSSSDSNSTTNNPHESSKHSRPSGLKSLKAAFGSSRSKQKDYKNINVEYLPAVGTGEPEVDSSGMDYRDIMEEPCMAIFRPHLPDSASIKHNSSLYSGTDLNHNDKNQAKTIVHFEKGHEIFKRDWEGVRVIRVIN
ncbi:uncharacterized protein I303_104456 [Kwoniella dejecticola CBS 10117]|uniref:Enoyl reductase (ER) domain-containing protein n=1 Tax=Kwoniella dejecticola CBS 10117 TaxID=1296121 RepID=A0A1A6A5B0_9TREE|nr:uncharacterized protein I303_04566 [Kwoniella dejecticola CBS 10117]OBR85233.1 hypothetical protein I303_04566 [Kwoniella dejecticola CBS 10117]